MKSLKQFIKAVYNRLYYYCCPDKIYLNNKFREVFGRNIDWKNPTTFNEKLQWLKIYDRNPLYTKLVDKYEVRKYIAEKIGEEHLIPCLGVWDRFEDIDFDKLPDQFVLKCTHDSGGLVLCRDKSNLDIEAARKKINASLKRNFYYVGREWPYKHVKPRIIAEKYMVDESGYELKDYKWFSFDGATKAVLIAMDRQADVDTKFDFFDIEFQHLPFTHGHPNSDRIITRPQTFDEMRNLADKLSEGHPHVRVDFYDVNGKVYFGELTFFHHSGMVPFSPEQWDKTFGEWIELPKVRGGT